MSVERLRRGKLIGKERGCAEAEVTYVLKLMEKKKEETLDKPLDIFHLG